MRLTVIKIYLIVVLWGLATPLYGGDRELLLGRWNFKSSNVSLPTACHKAYLDFVSISRIHGSDGVREGVLEYSVEENASGQGYNLIAIRLSNNGKKSCHGEDMEDNNSPKLLTYYIVLSPDQKDMKFYLTDTVYHHYERAN